MAANTDRGKLPCPKTSLGNPVCDGDFTVRLLGSLPEPWMHTPGQTLVSNVGLEILVSCALSKIGTTCWVKLSSDCVLQALTYLPYAIEVLVT